MVAKAYCYTSARRENGPGKPSGADSTPLVPGKTVAVSRDLWASMKGKNIHIQSVGFRRVNDKMAARHRKSIDILMATRRECLATGVQKVVISTKD